MAKIMLVEDDNSLREIYQARLLAEGYDIVAAKDGEEALALVGQEKPDLIILDVMMPKISGFDTLDIIRSTAATKAIKVVMMTALSQAEDKARAEKLGADRYLVKSQVTLEDIVKTVKEVLGEDTGSSSSSSSSTPAATPPADADKPADPPEPASSPAAATVDDPPATLQAADPAPVVQAPTPAAADPPATVSSEPTTIAPDQPVTIANDPPATNQASQLSADQTVQVNNQGTQVSLQPITPTDSTKPDEDKKPAGTSVEQVVDQQLNNNSTAAAASSEQTPTTDQTKPADSGQKSDSNTAEQAGEIPTISIDQSGQVVNDPHPAPKTEEQPAAPAAAPPPAGLDQPAADSAAAEVPEEDKVSSAPTPPPSSQDESPKPDPADKTADTNPAQPNKDEEVAKDTVGGTKVINPIDDMDEEKNKFDELLQQENLKEGQTSVGNVIAPASGDSSQTTAT